MKSGVRTMFPCPVFRLSTLRKPKNLPYVVWGVRLWRGSAATALPFHSTKGTTQMAAKTKTITVQVDERLAAEIEGTTVHNWRTTTFASGKRRVYATFESVKTVGGVK